MPLPGGEVAPTRHSDISPRFFHTTGHQIPLRRTRIDAEALAVTPGLKTLAAMSMTDMPSTSPNAVVARVGAVESLSGHLEGLPSALPLPLSPNSRGGSRARGSRARGAAMKPELPRFPSLVVMESCASYTLTCPRASTLGYPPKFPDGLAASAIPWSHLPQSDPMHARCSVGPHACPLFCPTPCMVPVRCRPLPGCESGSVGWGAAVV